MNRMRVHLAHDWLVGMRGGERVLDRLAQMFGPTTLYTLVNDGKPLSEAIDNCDVRTSPLQHFPGATGGLRRWYLPLMPWAVERLQVRDCDLLISTSSAVMKSIRPPNGVPHVCYCHSPARYIWGQGGDYEVGAGGGLRRMGLNLVRKRFQNWDRRTASRVTQFLANSQHTAKRINDCYGRDAEIVYPPVRTEFFTIDPAKPRDDWYLIVAALEPYKRTDLVIDAARKSGFQLKVAGGGSQLNSLRESAPKNVEFLGRVNDEALRDLYQRAQALIFPQVEDFGIVPVEAQAAGCPVIAFAGGGAMETVTEKTGVFFNAQSVDAIVSGVKEFEGRRFENATCRDNALRFSEAAFDAAIRSRVDQMFK